jgi:prepilin signal peptidase PulO-like enzyme (type II secretory pathway)
MHAHSPLIAVGLAVLGLVVGAGIAYIGPYLSRTRVPEAPVPPPGILLPVAGPLLWRWRPITTIGLELLTAALFAGLYLHYGASIRLPIAAAATALLLLIASIDFEHRLVLNSLSLPGTIIMLAVSPLWPGLGLESAALGAVAGFLIFLVFQIIGRGALGAGDTKLALLIGAMRGMPGVFNALFFGVVLGGVGALVYLIALRRGRKEYMPYGPYLAAGAIISFFIFSP